MDFLDPTTLCTMNESSLSLADAQAKNGDGEIAGLGEAWLGLSMQRPPYPTFR